MTLEAIILKTGILRKVQQKSITKFNPEGKDVSLTLGILFKGKPLEILEKYEGNEFVFPRLTGQYVNHTLKKFGEIAKINFPLTFHASRHTFILFHKANHLLYRFQIKFYQFRLF